MVQDILTVNAVSVSHLSKVFMDRLMLKQNAAILVVGSGIRAIPAPAMCLYSSTKNWVYYFCKTLGSELKKQGSSVKVVCFEPGGVATKMT